MAFYAGILLFRVLFLTGVYQEPFIDVFGGWEIYNEYYGFSVEIIESILMFVPFSILLLLIIEEKGTESRKQLMIGTGITFSYILLLEFVEVLLKAGNFRFSDLVYETLGGCIGCGLYQIIRQTMRGESTMDKAKDNVFEQTNIEIVDNVMKYGKEAIQVSNISQIRVSKEPAKPYPSWSIIGLFVCIIGCLVLPVIMGIAILGVIVCGFSIFLNWLYNLNLNTYLIVEMNSGRISLFSAKEESFLEKAKDSLIQCFNNKNIQMMVNFSECVVSQCNFGDNGTIKNKEE